MGKFKRENKFGGNRRGGDFSDRRSGRSERPEMHRTICSECGNSCEVPFRPSGDKPVFCNDCFGNKRGSESRGFDRNREESRGFGKRDFRRSDSEEKQMYKAVCSKCEEMCEVPFKPSSDKPVYCNDCFGKTEKRESAPKDNKQLEAINSKLDQIIKMLNSTVVEKKETPKPVKEVKVKEVAKPAKEVKTKETKTKEKKSAPVKKEVTKKKK